MNLLVLVCSLALANAAAVSDLNELLGVQNLVPAEFANIGGANGTEKAVVALTHLLSQPQALLKIYQQFKVSILVKVLTSKRLYGPIFLRNLQNIAKHNAEAEQGQHTYYQAVNRFTDRVKQPNPALLFQNFSKTKQFFLYPDRP